MKLDLFEKELQELDKDLSIRPNDPPARVREMFPDTVKLASVLYQGVEVCSMPNYDIFDEKNGSYGVDLRGDGRFIAHRSRPEVLEIVKAKLEQLKNKEYADQFFGRGEYSDANLRRVEPEVNTIVEEVKADVKPVEGGMIEGPK